LPQINFCLREIILHQAQFNSPQTELSLAWLWLS
jgi:hypothetical protein